MPTKSIYVMVPTYNEKENIVRLLDQLFSLKVPSLQVVVVDDNSPDGTAQLVQKYAQKNKKAHLILRKKNRGRGAAGRVGYQYCLEKGADIIIEMDADFSHNPKYIPKMIGQTKNADLVLGSRMVSGGAEKGRAAIRQLITICANLFIRIVLGLPVRDCNSGFRCFKREVLESINPKTIKAVGPAIVQEVLFKVYKKGFTIKEIPILFVDRERGKSKLGVRQLLAGYLTVLKLRVQSWVGA